MDSHHIQVLATPVCSKGAHASKLLQTFYISFHYVNPWCDINHHVSLVLVHHPLGLQDEAGQNVDHLHKLLKSRWVHYMHSKRTLVDLSGGPHGRLELWSTYTRKPWLLLVWRREGQMDIGWRRAGQTRGSRKVDISVSSHQGGGSKRLSTARSSFEQIEAIKDLRSITSTRLVSALLTRKIQYKV